MAQDTEDFTVGDGTAGNSSSVITVPLERDPDNPIAPFQMISMCGSITLSGSGAGDTCDAFIRMPLPGNNVYQMHSWFFAIETETLGYDEGYLRQYFVPKPGTAHTAVAQDYALQVGAGFNPMPTGPETYQYVLGHKFQGAAAANWIAGEFEQSPMRNFQPGTGLGGFDPYLHLGGGTSAAVPGGTASFVINFLSYTLEQWQHSALFTGLSNR